MTTPVMDITPEKIALYRASALRRQEGERVEMASQKKHAWEAARRAAQLLKDRFQVKRVVVFGSLIHEGSFTRWSDVDLAAWGIPTEQTFQAIGAVLDLDAAIEINLVDVNACKPSLLEVIRREGVDI
jgi:predicted nucleotidyltransferase